MNFGCRIVIVALLSSFVPGQAEAVTSVDLRPYFPAVTNVYRDYLGRAHAKYEFFFVPKVSSDPFWSLYSLWFDLTKPNGRLLIWRKIYASDTNPDKLENLNCTATYGHFYIGAGADKSIIEVGDWLNNNGDVHGTYGTCPDSYRALGYQKTTSFAKPATGLNWAGPASLDSIYSNFQSGFVFDQASPGQIYKHNGSGEYSSPGLVEILASWFARLRQGRRRRLDQPGQDLYECCAHSLFSRPVGQTQRLHHGSG
jgi:hypothetical protein